MKPFNNLFLILAVAGLALVLASCTGPTQYSDFYVSIQGSDVAGNGSQANPWRTIQYALDHATYSSGKTVRIHLAKGIYNENIVITQPVVVQGVGSSQAVSTGANPEIPIQNVSVVARQLPDNLSAGQTVKSIDINGAGQVTLQDLNVYGGGVTAIDSDFTLDNVVVYGVTGFYGVEVTDSSFSITDSRIQTQSNFYVDYGISIIASSGFITNTYLGNQFDHTINVIPWTASHNINHYNLPTPLNIYITGVTIDGSKRYYADGIRIQGPANVVIKDTVITRAPGGEPKSSGVSHNPPYAGIEVAGYQVTGNMIRRVTVLNSEVSGFDVGIGVNIETNQLMVEGTSIHGLSYGVQTSFNPYTDTTDPIVDFGGGPLGSDGKNQFSTQPAYAYYHIEGSYDVTACYNNWNVSSSDIDDVRIYDKLDDAGRGRVNWNCPLINDPNSGIEIDPQLPELLVAIPQQNVNCREGNNSSLFEVKDILLHDEPYSPLARGVDGQWLLFRAPTAPVNCWAYIGNLDLLFDGIAVELSDIPEEMLPIVSYPIAPTVTPTSSGGMGGGQPTGQPGTGQSTQCNDGIDNDGDGFVDLADPQCRDANDDDERTP